MNDHVLLSSAIVATQITLLVLHLGVAYLLLLKPVTLSSLVRLVAVSLVSTLAWVILSLLFFLSYFVCSSCYTESIEDRVAALTLALPFPLVFLILLVISFLPAIPNYVGGSHILWIIGLLVGYTAYLFGGVALSHDISGGRTLLFLFIWITIGFLSGFLAKFVGSLIKGRVSARGNLRGVFAPAWVIACAVSAALGFVLGRFVGRLVAWEGSIGRSEYVPFAGDILGSMIIIVVALSTAVLAANIVLVFMKLVVSRQKSYGILPEEQTPEKL